MKTIILTGGGTAGHVTPNIALLPELKRQGYRIVYIGSKTGMEKKMIERNKIKYCGISVGKMRRYLDIKNLTDTFRVVKGIGEAVQMIKKEKPNIIFSKGGFVSVPVEIAGWICKVPVVAHESDITPGLANRISEPFARAICASFPETLQKLPKKKGVLTGTPIRKELFEGKKERGILACGFESKKPIVMVMGGSSGSVKINQCLRASLPNLLKCFQVVHLCGQGNVDESIVLKGYKQFEFVSEGLNDLLAAADCLVSRAGANSIFEILALKKPNLLIPLSKRASRGDQILNAESFAKQGYSKVLIEENMSEVSLVTEIIDLYANREKYITKMAESSLNDGIKDIMQVIKTHENK